MNSFGYVVIEGIDGAGKTTLSLSLAQELRHCCYTPIPLAEPTWGRYGRMIREHMANGDDLSLERQHELFTLDRREHIDRTIKPILFRLIQDHDNFVIVQDRCYLSAPAYQARDEANMISLLREQQSFAPKPDVIFLLDIAPEIAAERKQKSDRPGTQPFDQITLEQVRQRYLFLAEEGSERVEILDANQSPESIVQQVMNLIEIEPVSDLEKGQS